jgi:hypothetical protein
LRGSIIAYANKSIRKYLEVFNQLEKNDGGR